VPIANYPVTPLTTSRPPFSGSTLRVWVTALLLVTFMWSQHEMQRHELQHVGEQLQRHSHQGLQNPISDPPCLECSLLAGGSHAIPGGLATLAPAVIPAARIAMSFISRSAVAGTYYSSRAPPSLL
jgi:hypothetical protein